MNTSIRFLNAGVLGAVLLLAANQANATIIVNDLPSSASGVEGAKNAPENPVGSGPEYSQGFSVSAGDGGDINSIKMDMSVLGTESGPTTVSGADTLSIYIYAANSSGVPTGSSLATIATGVTAADIEAGTSIGYISNNTSDIYTDTFSFSSYDLVGGHDYAIVVDVGDGTGSGLGQDVGWGETSTEGTGQLGQTQTDPDGGDPYATMEISLATIDPPVPDASSTVLLLGAALTGIGLIRRKLA
jgi:hypothetical protein